MSPTPVWYEGDEKLCVPLSHGNSNNPNRVYSRSKPSDVIQLTNIIAQSQEKPHIVYKNHQSNHLDTMLYTM